MQCALLHFYQKLFKKKLMGLIIESIKGFLTNIIRKEKYYSLKKALRNPERVRVLKLTNGDLKTIPTTIGQLRNLEILELSHNQLRSLPEEMGDLHELRELWLDYNQLEYLPSSMVKLHNLEVLWVDHNPLTGIPEGVEELPNIQEISPGNHFVRGAKKGKRSFGTSKSGEKLLCNS